MTERARTESTTLNAKRYLNRREVAEYLDSTQGTIAVKTSKRQIPHLKVGARVLYDVEEIDRWLAARRVPVTD